MASNTKLILITGATGQQGGAALKHVRNKGFAVRALTRNPDAPKARALVGRGTEVVRGDLNDRDVLMRSMDGAFGVYSVQALEQEGVEGEIRQGITVADAANRVRVSHLVYSSVASADQKTGIPHFESKFRIEEHIRGTGLAHTIIRPVFFMENWLMMMDQIAQGTISLPLSPDTRLQLIAVDDIGAAISAAFEHPRRWQGRTVELAADEMSMTEVAQAFTRIEGRQVTYRQIPWDLFEQHAGHEMTIMFRWFEEVGYHVDIPALRQEMPNITTFEKWMNTRLQLT